MKKWQRYKELLFELSKREIKQRYKQSILGYAWVIINPLARLLVLSFVFSKILRVSRVGVPYHIFVYSGLLPWMLFSNAIMSSTSVLISNSSLIKKIYFPRELFVISTIIAKLIDFLLASTVFIGFVIYHQIPISINLLWVIPILIIQLIFITGLSLMLSAFNLFYRDIQYLMGLVMTLWMYLTPVIYSVETMPKNYRFIFQLNPMAVLINAYRHVILNQKTPNLSSLGIATLLSFTMLFLGYAIFKKLEGWFADIV